MENTDKLFLEDETPSWYLAKGSSWIGPMAAKEILDKLVAQEVSWAHFAWKQGERSWRRLCDIEQFANSAPSEPSREITREVEAAAKVVVAEAKKTASPPPFEKQSESPLEAEERNWFLYYNDTQFGPFSVGEIRRYLNIGKIHGKVFAWTEGMAGWERLARLDSFQDWIPQEVLKPSSTKKEKAEPAAAAAKPEAAAEKRTGPRRPMVARLIMTNDRAVFIGVCRDVSIGGMQVLTNRVPGEIGARIKLNITPPETSKGKVEPFIAEGQIVRVLEDGRGFSFRFHKLTDSAKAAIEKFTEAE